MLEKVILAIRIMIFATGIIPMNKNTFYIYKEPWEYSFMPTLTDFKNYPDLIFETRISGLREKILQLLF